jgi:subtilisin family serine protease
MKTITLTLCRLNALLVKILILLMASSISFNAKALYFEALAVPNLPVQKRLPIKPAIKKPLDKVSNKIEQVINKPLPSITDALPETIQVLDKSGNPIFKEVTLKDGSRAVEHQWIVMLNQNDVFQLQQSIEKNKWPIEIVSQQRFNALATTLVTFKVSSTMDDRQSLSVVFSKQAMQTLDRNHVYRPQQVSINTDSQILANRSVVDRQNKNTSIQGNQTVCDKPVNIGVIDTAINLNHELFKNRNIQQKIFLPKDAVEPTSHGTAVVGRFFVQPESPETSALTGSFRQTAPLANHANVKLASVFYSRENATQGAALQHLLEGINWLINQQVPVINMSLTGPDNRLLKLVIDAAIAKGVIIVAAAGNEGPAAAPVYPAGYKKVIAVTAVDNEQNIYRWANQGEYIDFAALGVSVFTARSNGGFGIETGTSMAAPVVTAAIACHGFKGDLTVDELINRLAQSVLDLGDKGRDPVFGIGLIE